jgi:hypothetical protein
MEKAAAPLPTLVLHDGVDRDSIDPLGIAKSWLKDLQQKLSKNQLIEFSDLFIDESWWRDILGLSWNITTKRGMQEIGQYLQSQAAKSGFSQFKVIDQGALQPRLSDMGGLIVSRSRPCILVCCSQDIAPLIPRHPRWSPHNSYDLLKRLPSNFSSANFWFL